MLSFATFSPGLPNNVPPTALPVFGSMAKVLPCWKECPKSGQCLVIVLPTPLAKECVASLIGLYKNNRIWNKGTDWTGFGSLQVFNHMEILYMQFG